MAVKDKPLTTRQKTTMKKHSKHHTGKHMKEMTKMMMRGISFSEAHKKALKKVGS
jgi:carbamoylphosphate synthase large subunit